LKKISDDSSTHHLSLFYGVADRACRKGEKRQASELQRGTGARITATTNELLHVLDSHSITTLHITQSYYRVPTHKSIHLSLSLSLCTARLKLPTQIIITNPPVDYQQFARQQRSI
jgi:hypothetical protein